MEITAGDKADGVKPGVMENRYRRQDLQDEIVDDIDDKNVAVKSLAMVAHGKFELLPTARAAVKRAVI